MNYPTAVLMPAKRAAIEIRCGDPIVIHPGSLKKTPVDAEMDFRLREIVDKRALTPLFQPVVDLAHGKVVGYEGLIRGPSNSPLHSPVQLFRAAALCNRSIEVEHLCRRITLEGFSRMNLSGDLFLNVSPECLLHPDDERYGETLCSVHELGIDPQRVIIELTEHQPAYDYEQMRHAVRHYRSLGFRIAIDDLGEGFSSLRLWSELRPEFVKIDMHFIQGCNTDSVKKQFLRSIQEIARNSGSQVIAEGIETASELDCIQDIGIARGQGYFFARPAAAPSASISGDAASAFTRRPGMSTRQRQHAPSVSVLLRSVTPVPSSASTEEVYTVFDRDMDLPSLPVVDNGVPCGIIGRHALIDRLARPFRRELFGRKPCHLFMNRQPLLVELNSSLQELGHIIAEGDQKNLTDGFIIVEDGLYRGVGTGQDLMREITRMQMREAQHANALTGLPGNEPIDDAIHSHLDNGQSFWAAYCDLDYFKPFNDVYGFARGDDVIRLLAQALREYADVSVDFVGHIGGDDFLVLFRSPDWEMRCRNILEWFGATIGTLFSAEDLARGGYMTDDRHGVRVFTPLVSLSIGVIHIDPQHFSTHHQVSSAAALAKREAKKVAGNSLFVERREAKLSSAIGANLSHCSNIDEIQM